MTEDELIATFFAPLAGPGGLGLRDDTALLTPDPAHDIVTTVDALVAGVHFFADDPPASVAVKALGVNLSDLAAKGARPAGFLLALALPDGPMEWVRAFAEGLGVAARRHDCPLLGGDTVRTPGPLTLSITAFGTVPRDRMVPRTGLRPGDRLYVSGSIGDAALGLALRQPMAGSLGQALQALAVEARTFLADRYLHPQPRLGLAPALLAHASAGMDVSDGFVGDLTKMARASGVGAAVTLVNVPLSAAACEAVSRDDRALTAVLTGGDDYELLVGVPPARAVAFEAAAVAAGLPVSPVGVARPASAGVVFLDHNDAPVAFPTGAFQHFS